MALTRLIVADSGLKTVHVSACTALSEVNFDDLLQQMVGLGPGVRRLDFTMRYVA